MHTTIAYGETIAALGAQWVPMAAVADPHIKTEGDYIYIAEQNKIIGFYCLPGTLGEQIRILSPSIRRVNPQYVSDFETAVQSTGIVRRAFFPNIGLTLVPGEGLEIEQYVTANEVVTHIIFLAQAIPSPVQGNIHTIRFSTDPVRTASAWSFAEITLLDPLPVGSYDVVGVRLETATGIAFRLVPVGGAIRPGGVCAIDAEDEDVLLQRYGGLGVWCSFIHGMTPGIELICSATAVKETIYGYLDLIPK